MIEKHGAETEELQKKLVGTMLRIQFNPEIQKELQDIDMRALN